MCKRFLSILLAFLALQFALSLEAQMISNYGVIANVRGQVMLYLPDGSTTAARNGMKIREGSTVITGTLGAAGSGLLLFPNGASILVEEESRLQVSKFVQRMDPTRSPASDFLERGLSETEFMLEFGRLIGNVNKLNPNSRFDVKTPVGFAHILGTQFVIEVVKTPERKMIITYYTSKGLLKIVTVDNPAIGLKGGEAELPAGFKLVIEVELDEEGKLERFLEQRIEEIPEEEQPVLPDLDPDIFPAWFPTEILFEWRFVIPEIPQPPEVPPIILKDVNPPPFSPAGETEEGTSP